jgi:hypothetical protein
MALEWGKNITFTGIRKKVSGGKTSYPEKTHMNLMVADARTIDLRRTGITAIFVVIAIALISKFAVFDILDQVNQKRGELVTVQSEYLSLQNQLKDYAEVEEEFESYAASQLSAEAGIVSNIEALELVDKIIAPKAQVDAINLNGNTLSLSLSNITLNNLGKLVSTLYKQDMVANVTVSTAATQQTAASDVVASMTITLQRV